MTRYSKEFKENIIKQMMPPTNKSVNQLTAETGVSEHTLYAWKRAAKSAGIAAPAGESSSERWSSEDKFLIVLETVTMNQAELAAYCRGVSTCPRISEITANGVSCSSILEAAVCRSECIPRCFFKVGSLAMRI